jgi:surface protein
MPEVITISVTETPEVVTIDVVEAVATVVNSDRTYTLLAPARRESILPDVEHTDTGGDKVTLPAMTPMVCTPASCSGVDVNNSDDTYSQHVNDGATLVLPDTIVKNTAGTTVLTQPSCTNTGVVADSVVTNSDNTFSLNVPAETNPVLDDITITRKDANGQPILTAYPAAKDYTEVGSIPDANGWIRPPDWLPISHLVTDGEEKAVALYAVWDATGIANGYNNYCALYVTGNYTVDWGDGTVENFASGVQAEHTYVYANMPASSYCSRGYRQAIITITPQVGQHLTLINYSRKHTLNTVRYATNNFLDVHLSGTDLSYVLFYNSTYSQCKLLEKLYGYQVTNKLTTMSAMFTNCYSLQTLDLSSFNTAAVTDMTYMFYNCYSLQTLDLSYFNTAAVTTMSQMFYNCYSLQTLNLSYFNTAAVTTMSQMFTSCYSLQTLNLSSFNTAAVTTMSQMFTNCYSLHTLDLSSFNTAAVTTMYQMFYNCISLIGIDLSTTTLAVVTDNTQITNGTISLLTSRLPQIGRTFTVANNQLTAIELNLLFTYVRDLNGSISTSTINAAGTGYAIGDEMNITAGNNDAVLKVLTIGAGGAVATYLLKVAGTGYSVASGLATSNITGTGSGFKVNVTALVAPQTLTYTGNPGAATCDPSILTAKNWIGVG